MLTADSAAAIRSDWKAFGDFPTLYCKAFIGGRGPRVVGIGCALIAAWYQGFGDLGVVLLLHVLVVVGCVPDMLGTSRRRSGGLLPYCKGCK